MLAGVTEAQDMLLVTLRGRVGRGGDYCRGIVRERDPEELKNMQ